MAYSGTPLKFMGASFETFEPVVGTEEALAAAKEFAGGALDGLVLVGKTGVGKTHLAVAAARMRAASLDVPRLFFLNMPQFLDRIRATYGQGDQAEEADYMGPAQEWAVAIIDDLGAQRDTPWATERLYCIVDARHSAGLATVVTTNASPQDWEPRVRSRLQDRQGAKVCWISAPDYRKGKA